MHYDAQVQMIVSTLKISQAVYADPETGEHALRYKAKCHGGAKAQGFDQRQAIIHILEEPSADPAAIGVMECSDNQFYIHVTAPSEFFDGLMRLFPHCEPERGGYLSIDCLIAVDYESGVKPPPMNVVSLEYKMVKQLSSNPDLIARQ